MSSSETEDESDIQILEFESDPGSVHCVWVINAKSHDFGVLYTHRMNYKWYRQNVNQDGSIRMDCSCKKGDHHCRAKAYVQVTHPEPEVEGGPAPPPILTIVKIHTPEMHSHCPDNSKFIAEHIMQLMKNEITANPCNKIGKSFLFDSGCLFFIHLSRSNG